MKLCKLSLVAALTLGASSSLMAADTIYDAFVNGKFDGQVRLWHFDRDIEGGKDGSISLIGGNLTYITDSYFGFKIGGTYQYANDITTSGDGDTMFDGDNNPNSSVLSQGYVEYTYKNTSAKVGRQFIDTKLVAKSGSRIFYDSFEGAVITNTDLPGTVIAAGYVSKYQDRKDGEFGQVAPFSGIFLSFDDAYTALAINKSITGLTIIGQYALVKDVVAPLVTDDVSVYHAELNYVYPFTNFKLGADVAYRASSGIDGFEGDYLGLRLSLKEMYGFDFSLAYGSSDKEILINGMGNGADNLYTGTIIRGGLQTYQNDATSYLFDVKYDFKAVGINGLTLRGQYAYAEQDETNTDYTIYEAQAAYAFGGYMKGLVVSAEYSNMEKDVSGATQDTDEFRLRLNYSF